MNPAPTAVYMEYSDISVWVSTNDIPANAPVSSAVGFILSGLSDIAFEVGYFLLKGLHPLCDMFVLKAIFERQV